MKKNIYFNIYFIYNSCWICKKLIDNDEEIDHCHVTGKFRSAAHWDCNINFRLTKKVPVIFHNLRGYDSHLIFNELDKFDVKTNVIPNGLEKYMAFFLNKSLVFVNCLLQNIFYSSIKAGKIGDDGKISDGHISVKDYLTCERIWDKFEMKNMGDYHDYFLKKDVLQLADVFEKFIVTCLKY